MDRRVATLAASMQVITDTSGPPTAAPSGAAEPLDVQFLAGPLSAEQWAAYEAATPSYTCTRAFIEYFERPAHPTLALVRGASGDLRAAFLFDREDAASIRVLGRLYAPPAAAFHAFVEAVLARERSVTRIVTDLVDALDLRSLGRPALVLREGVELRVPLGGGLEEYHRSLSRDFLKRCRRLERKLAEALPAARFVRLEKAEVPRRWVAETVRLNRARMAAKSIRSVFDPHYEEGIFAVVREHGCVTVLLDGERVCAGDITICCGTEAFSWVLAHDDDYAAFRPGTLCGLASLRFLAESSVRTLHLLLGDSTHKREVGGKPAALASYLVLRSWTSLRPSDVLRLGRARSAILARRAVKAADLAAARVLKRPEPVKTFARHLVQEAQRLARVVARDSR